LIDWPCCRFRLTSEERQWRDVAFCLSLLPYKSDRSVKRLIEGLPFYQDKLHDAVVFKRFSEILAKARGNRSAAPGSTSSSETELQEFEQILEAARLHGLNDAELEGATQAKLAKSRKKREAATTTSTRATTRGGGGGASTRRTRRQTVMSDGDETP
jgi:condensin complex subunit 1